MANVIGIDLGTTYSAVAHLTADGRSEILRDQDGNNLIPSVVYVEDQDQLLVGWEAKRESVVQPERVAEFFKRQMGTEEKLAVANQDFSPMELSTFVLKKLHQIAQKQLGHVDEAVITVPANFTNQARTDTINAGKAAGLNVKHIINEPTAAAIYYAQQEHLQGRVAVYDLGGGTFDCSIVKINGQDVEILSSQGNQRLGGHDFDNQLLELVRSKYQADAASDYRVTRSDFGGKDLEELKKSLSNRSRVLASIAPPHGGRVNIEVTQSEFVDASSTLITKAEMLVEEALDEIRLDPSDIDHVVLVGGSTRIPAIQESVRKLFKTEPKTIVNVDEAVARGAAIYAAFKSDPASLNIAQKAAVAKVGIEEVTNHFFGTVALHFNEETNQPEQRVSILISKNATIPCEVTEPFYTVAENQRSVLCKVTQSPAEETDPRWVTKVWEGELGPFPEGRPANQEIRVTFSYDSNAVLHCSFLDVASGAKSDISLDLHTQQASGSVNIDEFLVE